MLKTKDLNRLEKKIINCFKGAAESTGCKLTVEGNGTYENLVTDKKLKSIFMKIKKLSLDMKTNESYDQSKNGSTDFEIFQNKFLHYTHFFKLLMMMERL